MKLIIGDATIDHYVHSGEKYAGGIAANFAANLVDLGHTDVTLISAIGSDRYADDFIKRMEEVHIDTEHIHRVEGQTSVQKIRITQDKRDFFGFTAGVLENFLLTDEEIKMLETAEIVFVPLSDGLEDVFEQVMYNKSITGIRITDFSRHADINGFGHGDIIAMAQHHIDAFDIVIAGGNPEHVEDIRTIAQANPEKVFVLTMGPDGSIGFHNGETHEEAAAEIDELVDTTGCGDAYRAAFITQWLTEKNIKKAMKAGSTRAATVASHMGAF